MSASSAPLGLRRIGIAPLGGLGAHRFYLGSAGWGILYLLFCWTFIPAVAAVIEGFVYLSTTDEDFAKTYA